MLGTCSLGGCLSHCPSLSLSLYIYIYICIYWSVYIYIYIYISAGPLVGPPGCEELVANFLAFLVFTYPLVHDISM